LNYLNVIPKIRKRIKAFKPEILHAHFASSYGLLGALSGFHPLIISVWGYDVFSFPNISSLHKKILEYNFSKADQILSTSHIMANEAEKYTSKEIVVTPFGIDLDVFKAEKTENTSFLPFDAKDIVIGTAKPLEKIYGIHDLIEAFALLLKKFPQQSLKLCIAGDGQEEDHLKTLSKNLGIADKVLFIGKIKHRDMPAFLHSIDMFAALSTEESFGVAIIEASACAKPVVVSNAAGLLEVVEHNKTGIIVNKHDPVSAAKALETLMLDPILRENLGVAGRERVERLYDWKQNLIQMNEIYKNTLNKAKSSGNTH
jgi:glycosyltransferase involved in cell wall biosynthesis